MARLPSPTPAATAVASLSQTFLDDFCNQDGTRAHQAGSMTSPAPRWLAIRCGSSREARFAVSRARPQPEPRVAPVEAPCTRAERSASPLARSGAEADSRIPEHPSRRYVPLHRSGLPDPEARRQGPLRVPDRANVPTLRGTGVLSTDSEPTRGATPGGPPMTRGPPDAHFSPGRGPTLTGRATTPDGGGHRGWV